MFRVVCFVTTLNHNNAGVLNFVMTVLYVFLKSRKQVNCLRVRATVTLSRDGGRTNSTAASAAVYVQISKQHISFTFFFFGRLVARLLQLLLLVCGLVRVDALTGGVAPSDVSSVLAATPDGTLYALGTWQNGDFTNK